MEFADLIIDGCQFLVFPAFRLQSIIKERFGGTKMWNYIDERLKIREKDTYMLGERAKFMKRAEEMRKQDFQSRYGIYKQMKEEWLP